MQYTLEHGDICLGNDVIGLSKAVELLNQGNRELAELLLPYAIADAEDGGEDYAEYAKRLRDTAGVGQINEALNEVADRMIEIRAKE